MKKRFQIISLLILVFASSCIPILSAETKINLTQQEKWTTEITLVVPTTSAALISSTLQYDFESEIEEYKKDGVKFTWEQLKANEQGIPFKITFEGQGLDTLNKHVFYEYEAFTQSSDPGNNKIYFNYPYSDSLFDTSLYRALEIKGGKLIATNGKKINSSTVRWEEPSGEIFAVFEPRTTDPLTIIILLIGIGLVIIGVSRSKRADQNQTSTEHAIQQTPQDNSENHQTGDKYCKYCGEKIPVTAGFCPKCGQKL